MKILKMLCNMLKWLFWLCCKFIGFVFFKIKLEDFVDVWFGVYVSERWMCFNEMEYYLFFEVGVKVLWEILSMMECDFLEVYFLFEVCFVMVDEIWFSLFYCCVICLIVVYYDVVEDFMVFFNVVEFIFCKYDGWLYWGKMYSLIVCDFVVFYFCFMDVMEVCCEIDFDNCFIFFYFVKILDV